MEEAYIQSRQNEQVKNLVKLRERKHRDRQQRFLVEGRREIGHAIGAGFEVEDIYFCPEQFPSAEHSQFIDQLRRAGAVRLTRMSEEAFRKASHREGPDGLLGVALQQSHSLNSLKMPKNPLILAIEGMEKPGNLGAILRSADGAGVDAVVLVDCVLDLYNPNAIRSSQGLVFALPVAQTDQACFSRWIEEKAIKVCATTPDTEHLHWDVDMTGPLVLLMGSESEGLREFWLRTADLKMRIPMAGRADSLNVAAAATVCLYEARRQRMAR
jgi:TrmH family RNA methyltransferase